MIKERGLPRDEDITTSAAKRSAAIFHLPQAASIPNPFISQFYQNDF